MSRKETQEAIIRAESFWGTWGRESWPDCGAVPPLPYEALTQTEISEDCLSVLGCSIIAGIISIDRLDGESLEDFKARIHMLLNTAPSDE